MASLCTSGGKGNVGMFFERSPRICAAGLPSLQPGQTVADCLKSQMLQDEADALISDVILPKPKEKPLPPLRKPIPRDTRYRFHTESKYLINPEKKTKFQNLVEEFKETVYDSYWNKPVGVLPDRRTLLPEGLDPRNTTFGKKNESSQNLYDLVMPSVPLHDFTPNKQTKRIYCQLPFNPNACFGMKTNQDISGRNVERQIKYDYVLMGTSLAKPINTKHADYKIANESKLGSTLAPIDNQNCVPEGFTFGKTKPPNSTTVRASLVTCKVSPDKELIFKCLGHLNTVRKCLSKRFQADYFPRLYLKLKYFDKKQTGWLPKKTVYDYCISQFIRFDPSLLEPLLLMWKALDQEKSNINYKMFVRIINCREPSPEIPKIIDFPNEYVDFQTTYSEMVKPGQKKDMSWRAGLPSGRYLDLDYPVTPHWCVRAHQSYLPEETDMKCCLSPSIFTNLGISHRDMYAVRDSQTVKKVFEAAGEKLTEEQFDAVWDEATKYSSKGLVCFQTFRQALKVVKLPDENKLPKVN